MTNAKKSPADQRPPGLENWRGVGSYGTLGLEIVLSICFGFFGGRWLDGKFGTEPWLSALGFVFGVGAAIKAVMRAMREMAAEAAREEREQGNPAPLYDKRDERDERRDEAVSPDEPNASEKIEPGVSDQNGVSGHEPGKGER
ncbi:AtpZ/AtpI family protein [Polyangium aurulentum]|uniref:AtpZ/AtpI family protein n=1 Tax=Polyangium aurulentum TaxID=2567896 RepID=UPI0010AEA8D8|nr:AtpZ/AtpI family protein [Polyangium aurulentum]UQA60996.1 AtpZ/AtpI family protein [Polyangium aurulentum]